jgi:hypothetical protein
MKEKINTSTPNEVQGRYCPINLANMQDKLDNGITHASLRFVPREPRTNNPVTTIELE